MMICFSFSLRLLTTVKFVLSSADPAAPVVSNIIISASEEATGVNNSLEGDNDEASSDNRTK